jgi:hypothetical protein
MDSLRPAADNGEASWGRMLDRMVTLRDLFAARPLRPLALCALLSACASGAGDGPYFFADPGKYHFHNCEQLAAASKQKLTRRRELKELIDKSEQAAGGQIVSVLAYRSDYTAVNEELQVIDSTIREKKCAAATPPPSKGR